MTVGCADRRVDRWDAMPEDEVATSERRSTTGAEPAAGVPSARHADPGDWAADVDTAADQLKQWRASLDAAAPAPAVTRGPDDPGRSPGGSGRTTPSPVFPVDVPMVPSRQFPTGGQRRLKRAEPIADAGMPVGAHRPEPDQKYWSVIAPGPGRHAAPPERPAEPVEPEPETVAFPALPASVAASDELAIEVVGLRKSFKDMVAVDGVSFSVPKGRILGLLGPNGAGKTTIVNMLTTLLRPDGGSAKVAGHDIVGETAAVRRSIMLTGQFAALDEALSGRENLVMFGRLLGLRKSVAKRRAEELLAVFGLTQAGDRKVREYSGGMRRRIDIACGLVTEPKVVFLDEPTTGLDPRSRQDVWNLVEQLRDVGVTVLLTTQYLEEADLLADRIVVIDKGRVIAEGTADELKEQTGAAYCELTPAHPAYLPRLKAKLSAQLGLQAISENGRVAVPAPEGAQTLSEVLRCVEQAQIPLADISLRKPSLDEAFLALTEVDDA